jgi:peptidoglycan/LPS O-acetylase OafA/YrhL
MKRIEELDAVRGLAAVGVVMFHAYPSIFFLGWSCVDLFFVLSGFLITTIIIGNLSKEGFLIAFYTRRALRIWPLYYLTLAAVLILNGLSKVGYGTDGLYQHLVFAQNIQGYWLGKVPSFPYAFGPSWSVAIEEQFYLVWPLLLLVTGARSIPVLAGLALVATVTARIKGLPIGILLGRADGLAFGCLLAFLASTPVHFSKLKRALAPLGLMSFAYICVLAYVWWRDPEPRWRPATFLAFGIFYFSVVGLIISHSGHAWLRILRWKWLGYLSLISYSLYLFHIPIFTYLPVIARVLHLPFPTVVVWIAVFAIPAFSYRFIERPILELKDRVSYQHRKAPADLLAAQDMFGG